MRMRLMDETATGDSATDLRSPRSFIPSRVLVVLLTVAAVLTGVFALHSLAGGPNFTHSVASIAAPHDDLPSSAGAAVSSQVSGLSAAHGCDTDCQPDCDVAMASCALLFVVAAAPALPAPAFALAHALSAWPLDVQGAGTSSPWVISAPSLLELSISRV